MTIEEENRLLYNLVFFIAHDYVELSHDKIEWQLNDYRKRCQKLLNQIAENTIANRNKDVRKFDESF